MKRTILLAAMASFLTAFVGTAAAFALYIPSLAHADGERLRAEQVTVVGADGTDRVRLRTGPGTVAGIDIFAADGRTRAVMETGGNGVVPNPDAGSFTIRGGDGTVQMMRMGSVNNNVDGTVVAMRLFIADNDGHQRVRMSVAADGSPSLEMLDADGNVIWSAP